VNAIEFVRDLGSELAELDREIDQLSVAHIQQTPQLTRGDVAVERTAGGSNDPGRGIDLVDRNFREGSGWGNSSGGVVDQLALHRVEQRYAGVGEHLILSASCDRARDADVHQLGELGNGLSALLNHRGGITPKGLFAGDFRIKRENTLDSIIDGFDDVTNLTVSFLTQVLYLIGNTRDLSA
tara:strand:- start:44 stop:589 length:546 start_codon:yes stop_codon:yes gene_type:complete